MQYCGQFLRIHLRHIKLFYDVYLLSLIAKSTFKIIFLGWYVLRLCFIYNTDYPFICKNLLFKNKNNTSKCSCITYNIFPVYIPVLRIYLSYVTSPCPTYTCICPMLSACSTCISVLCYKSLSYVYIYLSHVKSLSYTYICPIMTHGSVLRIYLFYRCPCPADEFVRCMSLSYATLYRTLLLGQVTLIAVPVNISFNNIYISTILTIINNKHNIIDQ